MFLVWLPLQFLSFIWPISLIIVAFLYNLGYIGTMKYIFYVYVTASLNQVKSFYSLHSMILCCILLMYLYVIKSPSHQIKGFCCTLAKSLSIHFVTSPSAIECKANMIDPEFNLIFFFLNFHFFLSGHICTFKEVFIQNVCATNIVKSISQALTLHFVKLPNASSGECVAYQKSQHDNIYFTCWRFLLVSYQRIIWVKTTKVCPTLGQYP